MTDRPSAAAIAALHEARLAERAQTQFYRALAAQAERRGDAEAAERINGLLADEQHHFSRLSARLIELGETLAGETAPAVDAGFDRWEHTARAREREEAARYVQLLALPLDDRTRIMIREFHTVEELHTAMLGGKWMKA